MKKSILIVLFVLLSVSFVNAKPLTIDSIVRWQKVNDVNVNSVLSQLEAIVATLKKINKSRPIKIKVAGFSDESGTLNAKRRAGKARAEEVSAYLNRELIDHFHNMDITPFYGGVNYKGVRIVATVSDPPRADDVLNPPTRKENSKIYKIGIFLGIASIALVVCITFVINMLVIRSGKKVRFQPRDDYQSNDNHIIQEWHNDLLTSQYWPTDEVALLYVMISGHFNDIKKLCPSCSRNKKDLVSGKALVTHLRTNCHDSKLYHKGETAGEVIKFLFDRVQKGVSSGEYHALYGQYVLGFYKPAK